MKLLASTLRLYRDAAIQAARAFARSALALAVLVLCYPALALTAALTGPIPVVGGMVQFLVECALAGTYLACLQDALHARAPLSIATIRRNFGRMAWDLVNVRFVIWVAEFLVHRSGIQVLALVFTVATYLALNALPEMLGRSREGGAALAAACARFMLDNGIEWFSFQLPLVAVLYVLGGVGLATAAGPSFVFVRAGQALLHQAGSGPAGWAAGLAVVAAFHLLMLMRGAVYERLAGGGRRARAWAENFR